MSIKDQIRRALSIALIGTISYLSINCSTLSKVPKKAIYSYVLNKHFNEDISNTLIEKLNPFDRNDKKFIKIIYDYPLELQRACVNSDILNNKHISNKELEATKKATLEGIVNPKEVYAVLANGSADEGNYFLENTLIFYKQLRDNNIDDDNIALLVYNPNNRNIFETETYKFYSEVGIRRTTIEDGKTKSLTTSLSKLLPKSESEIKIDLPSTRDNLLDSIKNIPSDYNDTIYIGYFSHGVNLEPINQKIIEFSGENIGNISLNHVIGNLEYNKMTLIQDSCFAAAILKDLNTPRKIKNVLAIASMDVNEESGVPFFIRFIIQYLNNPKRPLNKIMDLEKATYDAQIEDNKKIKPQVFYFNEKGENRPPEECPWYYKPFITPQ